MFTLLVYSVSTALFCLCVFQCSLALTSSLHQLAQVIPELRRDILDGLIKMLSVVLMGRPLQHPGAPKSPAGTLQSTRGGTLPTSSSLQNLVETPDVASITLALRTLGTFDFAGDYI